MSKEMGISKEAGVLKSVSMSNIGMHSRCTALMAIATVIFGVTLHSSAAKAQQGSAPNDSQIVGIVLCADQVDIDYANLAMSKAKDQQVKDFAHQMITDHSSVQKSVEELAGKLNVTPADSPTSTSLKTQAHQTLQKLQHLKGKEFEKAYIDNEVAYHQAVINAVKTVLIPNAQNTGTEVSPGRDRANVRRSSAARSAGTVHY